MDFQRLFCDYNPTPNLPYIKIILLCAGDFDYKLQQFLTTNEKSIIVYFYQGKITYSFYIVFTDKLSLIKFKLTFGNIYTIENLEK